jgi:large subunit ribosomal protein L15
MKLNLIADHRGALRDSKRLGRGIGSGKGKTCGRGYKGQKSRTGVSLKGFEGGQMPLIRRLPKRGFVPYQRKRYAELTFSRLMTAFEKGVLAVSDEITAVLLKEKGLVKHVRDGVRLIGSASLKEKISVRLAGVSTSAKKAIEEAGGKVLD